MAATTTEDPFAKYSDDLLLARSITGLLPAFFCLIVLIATLIPFIFDERFKSVGIKKLIRYTVILYFFSYLIQTVLIGIDEVIDNYQIYRYDGKFDLMLDLVVITFHILGHVIFYIYLMERLYILFTDTKYAVTRTTFKVLVFVAINIEIYHFTIHIVYEYDLFEHYDENWHLHELLLGLFVILNVSFALSLIGLFVNKLFKIIVTQRKSISVKTLLHSDKSDIDSIRNDEFDLDFKQINIVQTITKNCVLIISAIIWRNIAIVFLSIILHKDEENISWNGVYILCGFNIALICELLSVYLTFSFARKGYKCLCGKIHNLCYRYCQTYAKSKTMQADRMKISTYVAMIDYDDEY